MQEKNNVLRHATNRHTINAASLFVLCLRFSILTIKVPRALIRRDAFYRHALSFD
jgi:hypothetical protein